MATITEDYVSFEIAKLLKEKGFDVPCNCYGAYNGVNLTYRLCITDKYTNWNKHTNKLIISCPTIQMAMKWLREVHNIFICIVPSEVGAGVMDYTYVLYKIDAKNFYFEDLGIQGRAKNISEISYKKSVEAAIRYCLENLI